MSDSITKIEFKKIIWRIINYFYKISLILGIHMLLITISFYIDFIYVKDYHFDAVLTIDTIIVSIIIIRNLLAYFIFKDVITDIKNKL